MSWKKFKKYNRNAEIEQVNIAWNFYCEEAYSGGYERWEEDWWWTDMHDYYYGDNPQNMGEYHQLKLLTLLHRLYIKPAKDALQYQGWL